MVASSRAIHNIQVCEVALIVSGSWDVDDNLKEQKKIMLIQKMFS